MTRKMTRKMTSVARSEETQAEGQLCSAFLIVSSRTDRALTQDEVDAVLGVHARPPGAAAGTTVGEASSRRERRDP